MITQKKIDEIHRDQQEYLGHNKPVNKVQPLVSVYVTAYQHARYITACLEGILTQEFDAPLEIVLGEDHSQDGTREICMKYAEQYPDKIRLFLRDRAQTSITDHKGKFIKSLNGRLVAMSCRGKYIAMCEGDDYWTDKNKLTKQIAYLENHPNFNISAHNVTIEYDEYLNEVAKVWPNITHDKSLTLADIFEHGNPVSTCSLVFRKDVVMPLPEWYSNFISADTTIQILSMSKGKMRILSDNMGVYRKHVTGVSVYQEDTQAHIDRLFEQGPVKMEFFNNLFDGKYDVPIRKQLVRYYYHHLIIAHYNNMIRNLDDSFKYARLSLVENKELRVLGVKRRLGMYIYTITSKILLAVLKMLKGINRL